MFLDVVYKNYSHSLVIILRPSCSSHHLQYICDGVIYIALCLAIKILSPLHYHKVSRKVHSPSQSASCNQNLQLIIKRQFTVSPKYTN